MDGTDVLGSQLLHVFDDIPAILQDCLPFVEDGDAVTLNLFQQFQIAGSIQRGVDTYHLSAALRSLSNRMQPFDNLFSFRFVGSPLVTTSAQGEERYFDVTHLVHGVETVTHECQVIVTLGKVLSVESTHSDGSNTDAETVGDKLEAGGILRIAHLVVKHFPFAKTAHVHFHTVTA